MAIGLRLNRGDGGQPAQIELLKSQLAEREQAAGRVAALEAPLAELREQVRHLAVQGSERAKAEGELKESLKQVVTLSTDLQKDTHRLTTTLTRSQDRGAWGQDTFEQQLLAGGLIKGVHFTTQTSVSVEGANLRPDFLLNLPGDAQLVVDAKFPMSAYLEAEAADEAARPELLKRHAKEVVEHAKALSRKRYADHFDGPNFVVMYLPFESLWSEAMRADSNSLKQCLDVNVVPITPSTAFPLISLVLNLWQQSRLETESAELAKQATKFVDKLATMAQHLNDAGSRLNSAATAFNEFVSNFNNSFVREARKLHVHGAQVNSKLAEAKATEAKFAVAQRHDDIIDIEPVDELGDAAD